MVAGKNHNIQTRSRVLKTTTGSAAVFGSSVAAGKTRYVTFVGLSRIDGKGTTGSKVWICSTAASQTASTDTAASAAAKMVVILASAVNQASAAGKTGGPANFSVPKNINTDKPLFTIAASKFLTAREASTAAKGNAQVSLFMQWYDQ